MSMPEKYVRSAVVVFVVGIALAVLRRRWAPSRPPYPPGPKGYPVIGNVLDFPKDPVWEGFAAMAKEHDTEILHLDMMGSHVVVLSSSDIATDLLERRGVVYGDRPPSPMLNELMECTWALVLMSYGNLWRTSRRLFHRFFNLSTVSRFDDKIHKAVNVFLHRLSESPERFLKHVHFLTVSLNLSIAYGVNVESESDKLFSGFENAMAAVDTAMVPGTFLVDAFPILKYVPEWFPGAGFKTFARMAKMDLDGSMNPPFQYVKESFEAGTLTASSVVGTCFEELPELAKLGVDEDMIRGVGAVIYRGEESTASSIKSFFLAATIYPEIVRSGQRELDEVLGGERLPDFSDMPRLPYISAIVKEVLRWRPSTPLGTPHRLMEDDVYNGWFIPAGSTIMENTWAIFRNESVYPNAHDFNPDRFLKDGQINPEVKDPEQLAFGYGRRVCPGRHFAIRVLFLTIARTLAVFDISKSLDEDGNPIIPENGYMFGLVTKPPPFESSITPRSTQALSLIVGH